MASHGSSSATAGQRSYAWYRELNRYQWFVVAVASMGWMFDTMAQQLFNLARVPAHARPAGRQAPRGRGGRAGGLRHLDLHDRLGLGGVIFGVLGDRMGRAKTMMLTILCYTIFTGLSVFATGVWDFNVYRFLCGLGVGGQFAVGVALVAEVVPRAGAALRAGDGAGVLHGGQHDGGADRHPAGPAGAGRHHRGRLALRVSGRRAAGAAGAGGVHASSKSRSSGCKARAAKEASWGPSASCSRDPRWRRNAIVGLLLAFAGVVGLWGIGFFSYDLFRPVLETTFRAQGLAGAALAGQDHHLDRHHLAVPEPRRLLRRARLHLADALHRPQEGVRHQLRGGHGGSPRSRSGT